MKKKLKYLWKYLKEEPIYMRKDGQAIKQGNQVI